MLKPPFSSIRHQATAFRWWRRVHAELIVKSLVELLADLDDESRKQRQANSPVSIDEMIRQGEQLLSAPGIDRAGDGDMDW